MNKDTLTLNEIKKALYKQKPLATTFSLDKDPIFYRSSIDINGKKTMIDFYVPKEEASGFTIQMEAQLLIRWLD